MAGELVISYEVLHPSTITDQDVHDITELSFDLLKRRVEVLREDLVVSAMRHTLLVARHRPDDPKRRSRIIGMGRFVTDDSPFTGRSVTIADMVVARKFRGNHLSYTILAKLEELAREIRATFAQLRSNEKRTEAQQLYTISGFRKREDVLVFDKQL